jgi:hypothetical protein
MTTDAHKLTQQGGMRGFGVTFIVLSIEPSLWRNAAFAALMFPAKK